MVTLEPWSRRRKRYEVVGTVTWINDGRDPNASDLPLGFGIQITQIGLPAKLAIVNALKRSPAASAPRG